jgi:hypothetical protein
MKTKGFTGKRFRVRLMIGALVFAIIAASVISMYAQQSTGSLGGVIADPQNKGVAGASVTVRNTDTNVEIKVKTNKSGLYNVSGLLPGYYDLVVEVEGFAIQAVPAIRIGVGRFKRDVKLKQYPADQL